MKNGTEYFNVSSIDFHCDFSIAAVDEIISLPDAFEIVLHKECRHGKVRAVHYSYASLEQLFRVLDEVVAGNSRRVNFGTQGIRIKTIGGYTILSTGVRMHGPTEEIRHSLEDCIRQVLIELRDRGKDTQTVIEDISSGRYRPWVVDLEDVHRRRIGRGQRDG